MNHKSKYPKLIKSLIIAAALAIGVHADTPAPTPNAVLMTFGGFFPCMAGLSQFCDGYQGAIYLLFVENVTPGVHTLTMALKDGKILSIQVAVPATTQKGLVPVGPPVVTGAIVASYELQ